MSIQDYNIYKIQSIPLEITNINDEFSKELIDLWNFNKSKGYIYYIGNQNDIIGYCLLDDSNTIRGFFIKNEYRNLGLGTKLLQHVINENCSKTIVVNINKPAVNVYTKLGFKILGERRDFNLLIGYYGDLDNDLKTKLYNKLK